MSLNKFIGYVVLAVFVAVLALSSWFFTCSARMLGEPILGVQSKTADAVGAFFRATLSDEWCASR